MKLKDGRTAIAMPWSAQTPKPWKDGYTRVFIPFTAAELKNAKHNGARGHIQIVRNSKLVKDAPKFKPKRAKAEAVAA